MNFIYGFLLGCVMGVLGHYRWVYYKANQPYLSSTASKNKDELIHLFEHYPSLMDLMKRNVSDPEYYKVREFFVVDPLAIMNSSVPRVRYDLSDEFLALLQRLEHLRYIERIEHDSLLYRMQEDFILQLKAFSPLPTTTQPL